MLKSALMLYNKHRVLYGKRRRIFERRGGSLLNVPRESRTRAPAIVHATHRFRQVVEAKDGLTFTYFTTAFSLQWRIPSEVSPRDQWPLGTCNLVLVRAGAS